MSEEQSFSLPDKIHMLICFSQLSVSPFLSLQSGTHLARAVEKIGEIDTQQNHQKCSLIPSIKVAEMHPVYGITRKGEQNFSKSVVVDDATRELPSVDQRTLLERITFRTCPGSSLEIKLIHRPDLILDRHGMTQDSWWSVQCNGLPERKMRLLNGAQSMLELLRRYGFQDETGCVNHRDIVFHYGPVYTWKNTGIGLTSQMQQLSGVPQFFRNSGICWFNALCWVSFANKNVVDLLCRHANDKTFKCLATQALVQRDAALNLRKHLWDAYGIGDDISQPPEMDGKNGGYEFLCLCAALKIPIIVYENSVETKMRRLQEHTLECTSKNKFKQATVKKDEAHLLMLRFIDGDHSGKCPVHRRVCINGVRYKLVGIYMGQRKCGHQIAISFPDMQDWRYAVIGDADMHKDKNGPQHIYFGKEHESGWWSLWQYLVHVTKFGKNTSEFCPLTPWNIPNNALDRYRGAKGSNSLDLVFMSCS